jgi:hypothetical protein
MLTDKFSISHDFGVKFDPQSLGVVRRARANLSVGRIIGVSSDIPDGGLEDPLVLGRGVMLQEYVFDSPEASSCKRSDFRSDCSCAAKTKA